MDRERGIFADASKVNYADYRGKYVNTRGPLAMPRTPQGHPVFMQAGSSPRGREFAARWAEMIFCTPHARSDAQTFYNDIKQRMDQLGRAPEDCAVLPAFGVVLGETESIAREKAEYLDGLIDPELTLAGNSHLLGVDLSKHRTAAEIDAARGNQGVQGSHDRVAQLAAAEGISIAEAAGRPRNMLVGTAASVADYLEDWFTNGAADGFIFWPTMSPNMFEEVTRLLVPELQRRGLLRTEYHGRTLRENLRSP